MLRHRVPRLFHRRWVIAWSVASWAVAVLAAFGLLSLYAQTPGVDGSPAESWPTDSDLEPTAGLPTLVLFLHPLCPCSHATLEELSRILARNAEKVHAIVAFTAPSEVSSSCAQSSLCRAASDMPHVRLVFDKDGSEARRFGVTTSGATLFFGASGTLLFAGGITSGRGHAGPNAGVHLLVEAIRTGQRSPHRTAVFGCSLLGDPPVVASEPRPCH